MGEFLKNYVDARKELPENGEMTFSWNAKQREMYAWIDPEQMQRILDNLLENSRKYAGADKLEITISLEKRRDGPRISFRDNGVGVPGEKLPHIFEEFYRGDESRNQKEGNGLGLYIVKYLVEAMGGRAWAENDNGLVILMELPYDFGG